MRVQYEKWMRWADLTPEAQHSWYDRCEQQVNWQSNFCLLIRCYANLGDALTHRKR